MSAQACIMCWTLCPWNGCHVRLHPEINLQLRLRSAPARLLPACGSHGAVNLEQQITKRLFIWLLSLIDMLNWMSVIYLSEQKRLAAKQREDAWEGKWPDNPPLGFFFLLCEIPWFSRLLCFLLCSVFLNWPLLPTTKLPRNGFPATVRYPAVSPLLLHHILLLYFLAFFVQGRLTWTHFHTSNTVSNACPEALRLIICNLFTGLFSKTSSLLFTWIFKEKMDLLVNAKAASCSVKGQASFRFSHVDTVLHCVWRRWDLILS